MPNLMSAVSRRPLHETPRGTPNRSTTTSTQNHPRSWPRALAAVVLLLWLSTLRINQDAHVLRIISLPAPPPAEAAETTGDAAKVEAVAAAAQVGAVKAPQVDKEGRPVGPCGELATCAACQKRRAAVPDDGIRCVWCVALGQCRDYVKSRAFPCADATRKGGGYPGGDRCPGDGGAAVSYTHLTLPTILLV